MANVKGARKAGKVKKWWAEGRADENVRPLLGAEDGIAVAGEKWGVGPQQDPKEGRTRTKADSIGGKDSMGRRKGNLDTRLGKC